MTVTADNVAVGKPNLEVSGGVLVAPSGSTLPTDATTVLDGAFLSVGYVSSDGVSETADRSTQQIYAWGGTKVRTVQTEYGLSLSFTLIESRNAEALKFVFGEDNVEEGGEGLAVRRNEKVLPHLVLVVDMKDGENARRLVAGNAQVTEIGDVTYVDGEPVGYEVTVSCDPDEDGDSMIEYLSGGGSGN